MKNELISLTAKNVQSSKECDVLSINYETQRILVGKGDIDKVFRKMEDHRDIRNSQVQKLFNVLCSGNNFAGIFLVNKRGDEYRMIDCNHRYNAMKLFFDKFPDKKIWVELHIHNNLSDEQERIEFSKSNSHITQLTKDYVKMYKRDMNLYKAMDVDDFPVKISHTNDSNRIAFHTLMHPYMVRNQTPYVGGFQGSAMDFIDAIRTMNVRTNLLNSDGAEALKIMRAFLTDYVSAFGRYRKSPIWAALPLYVIFKIWYDNYKNVTPDIMVKRLQRAFLDKGMPKEMPIVYWAGMGAPRGNCSKAIVEFLYELNRVGKYKFYIIDKEDDLLNADGTVSVKGKEFKSYGRKLPDHYVEDNEE